MGAESQLMWESFEDLTWDETRLQHLYCALWLRLTFFSVAY